MSIGIVQGEQIGYWVKCWIFAFGISLTGASSSGSEVSKSEYGASLLDLWILRLNAEGLKGLMTARYCRLFLA